VTESESVAKLAGRYPQLVAKNVEFAVNAIFEAMTKTLVKGQRIEIRGFGNSKINHRPPRTGRNPKSGQTVPVPEKCVPHFKAGRG
jgi:integration host factor subunit beta